MGAHTIVLFGGASGERRVSVASAQNVSAFLTGAQAWFVSPEGAVFDYPVAALARHERVFETDLPIAGTRIGESLAESLERIGTSEHVFFLAFHGGAGEDGSVQRDLERRHLAFTGSGSQASARAFDKVLAKQSVRAHDVRTADSMTIAPGKATAVREKLRQFAQSHGRIVAKPIADGSSVGLHHIKSDADVDRAADAIVSLGIPYLIEAFVSGTELTIGVVDDGTGPRALCASEVRLAPDRAFDFEGKYLGRGTTEVTPAEVPASVSQAAERVALAAHRALGCEGYSRTDVIVDDRGAVFLETNTLPGLTRASFIPQQLAYVGISMQTFLDQQIANARARAVRA